MNVGRMTNDIVNMFSNPKFLTALSMTTSVGATVASGVGTYYAIKHNEKTGSTGFKAVLESLPYYSGAVILEGISLYTNKESTGIALKTAGEFAAMYAITSNEFRKYKDSHEKAIDDFLGPKKKEEYEAAAVAERAKMEDIDLNQDKIWRTGEGNVLFKDCYTGQYFYSSYEAIATHKAHLDSKLMREMVIDIDDYCDEMNIPRYESGIGKFAVFSTAFCGLNFPLKPPYADWATVNGVKTTCGYLQFEEPPRERKEYKIF